MPLNWSIKNVENYEELWNEIEEGPEKGMKKLDPVVEYIVFATMYIGIQKITKDNYEKFYNRLVAYEKVGGKMLMENVGNEEIPRWKYRHIELHEIERVIGLGTNASTLTPAKFKKKLIERLEDDGEF